MLFFLGLELAALGVALMYAVRARLVKVVAALVLLAYLTVTVGLAAMPPYPSLPGLPLLQAHWLVYPLSATALSAAATWMAFRWSAGEWDGSDAHRLAERTGFACLGLTLLNVGVLVIVGIGRAVVDRG